MLDQLAGAIFTEEETFIIAAVGIIIAGLVLALLAFFGTKIYNHLVIAKRAKHLGMGSALLGSFGVIIIALAIMSIAGNLREQRWEDTQESCAKKAGYQSAADDNTTYATAEQQSAYRECLDS